MLSSSGENLQNQKQEDIVVSVKCKRSISAFSPSEVACAFHTDMHMVVAVNWNGTTGKLNFPFLFDVPEVCIEFSRWNIRNAASAAPLMTCKYYGSRFWRLHISHMRLDSYTEVIFRSKVYHSSICAMVCAMNHRIRKVSGSSWTHLRRKNFNCVVYGGYTCVGNLLLHVDERNSSWHSHRFSSSFIFLSCAARHGENVPRDITVDNHNANDNLSIRTHK